MKLRPSGYVPAAESAKPGYLAKRMAAYRMKVAQEKEARERAGKNVRSIKKAAA